MNGRYRVNEIFYSLQGEGFWTGTPVVFVRFSGCNLQCPFCDTDHKPYREMSAQEILREVQQYRCPRICLTGGEPLLQLDDELLDTFSAFVVHMETNGSVNKPEVNRVQWVTLSPKNHLPGYAERGKVAITEADEIKLVYDGTLTEEEILAWEGFPASHLFLQPCDVPDPARRQQLLEETIAFVQRHPLWRLSLQTHKLLNIR